MAMTGGAARTRRAFLVAPLVAPIVCAAVLVLGELVSQGSVPSARSAVSLVLGVFAVGAPLAYAAALVAGWPVYALLRRFGALTRWTLWLAAFAIGAGVAL